MVKELSSLRLGLEVFLNELSMETRMPIGMEDRARIQTDKRNPGGELILELSNRCTRCH